MDLRGRSAKSKWECTLYELVCTSPQMLMQHELGKKHAKAAARAEREKHGPVGGRGDIYNSPDTPAQMTTVGSDYSLKKDKDRQTKREAVVGDVDCCDAQSDGANAGVNAGTDRKGPEELLTAGDWERVGEVDARSETAHSASVSGPSPMEVQTFRKAPPAGGPVDTRSLNQEDPCEIGNASIPLQAPPASINHFPTRNPVFQPTAIVMDALNWLTRFWNVASARRDPWRELGAMRERVTSFVRAARASGLALVAVIDAATKTAEAQAKWRLRRNKEIRQEDKNVVLGIDGFYSEILEAAGVRVLRPLDADADDVIAALAAVSGPSSCVLSRDGDFFRYVPRVRVCNHWGIVRGRLRLTLAAPGSTSRASAREIDFALAKWAGKGAQGGGCKLNPSLRGGEVCRGTSSSSDKRLGNLHGITRLLRAAVYARLGERSAVKKWPDCDEARGIVCWEERELEADASLDALLDDPGKVVAWIEEHDGGVVTEGWRTVERAFSRCAIAAELCSAASRDLKSPLSMLPLISERSF